MTALVREACEGLGRAVDPEPILQAMQRDLYEGVPMDEVRKSLMLSARALIEQDPGYSYVTARLLLHTLRLETLGEEVTQAEMKTRYAEYLPEFIRKGIEAELLDERLAQLRPEVPGRGAGCPARPQVRLPRPADSLRPLFPAHPRPAHRAAADFLHARGDGARAERARRQREARAIEFYNVLSVFDFMSSTPTLFNSGTRRSQLASCYLTTVADDLDGIYEAIKENAMLQKYAGGIGNDWTPVRALGAHIKGTNGKSQGVVPFLKVVNDTAVAVNQGGKRKGAVCSYLETWHLDIEEFLELRKNTGDDRRRTHDMNTANWVPDLFMKRVMENGEWTLFSPSDVPDLHDKFGKAFETAYLGYEAKARARRDEAVQEDSRGAAVAQDADHAVRDRPSVDHVQGSVQHPRRRSITSASCTAPICAPRSRSIPVADEIAVCNLGSVNMPAHLDVQPASSTWRS